MYQYPEYGKRTGQYMAQWTTGIVAAALAADAPVAGIRVGATGQLVVPNQGNIVGPFIKAYVTGLRLKVQSVVAFTAAQQFGLYLQRYTGANLAAGQTVNPFLLHTNAAAASESVCKPAGAAGGEVRVATTAALTSAGVTFAGAKIPVYEWSTVGPAEYQNQILDFIFRPIRLDVGEGLALLNQIVWPAAGTAVVGGTIFWDESWA